VVTDEDRDQRARRILDEARALLERRVEPYVPPPLTAAISLGLGAAGQQTIVPDPVEPVWQDVAAVTHKTRRSASRMW
jgi:hypothetical protein